MDTPITKGPPPSLAASFAVRHDGENLPGNEWVLPVGEEVRLVISMTHESDRVICLTEFAVEKAEGPSGQTARVLRRDETVLREGRRIYEVTWDGRDEQGSRVAPARYRLVATLQTDAVECGASNGAVEGYGLGQLDVSGYDGR
ncbi:MAG TPA: hypothetical protein VGB64_14675 [Actinomycetota bacterium]